MSAAVEDHTGSPPDGVSWAAAALVDADAHPGVGLNLAELARAGGFLSGRPREDFVSGRILVRVLAAKLLNQGLSGPARYVPAGLKLAQHCPECGSAAHGAPRLRVPATGQSFALSYARTSGWLLLALAAGHCRLGADMADTGDAAFTSADGELLEAYAYSPAERRRLEALPVTERHALRARLWALKEAVAKAGGEGLAGPGGIPVVAGADSHRLLRENGTQVIELAPGTVDHLGNALPDNLCGSIVWAPGSAS